MNNDLQEMIKKAAAMKAVIAPVDTWMKLAKNPALAVIEKNKLYPPGINETLYQMFKKPGYFDQVKGLQGLVKEGTIKGKFFLNNSWWDSMAVITANQHNISAVLTKNLAMLPAYTKVQVAPPSYMKEIFEPAFPLGYSSKLATLESALKGLSSQIAIKGFDGFTGFAAIGTEFLEKFTTTTNEAVAITQQITEKKYATKADIERLETFIGTTLENFKEDIKVQIQKTAKSPFALVSLWVAIIGTILTIFTIIQTCQSQKRTQEDSITKEEIRGLKQYVDEKFNEALDGATIKAKARIDCHLRYKPSRKSRGFFHIQAGEVVYVIEAKHRWVRVTIIDPADNLPMTGWVLKKYLIRD